MERAKVMKLVLDKIAELTTGQEPNDAAAPNLVQEMVYELLIDNGVGEELANSITDDIFNFVSDMVVCVDEATGELGYI